MCRSSNLEVVLPKIFGTTGSSLATRGVWTMASSYGVYIRMSERIVLKRSILLLLSTGEPKVSQRQSEE